VVTNQFDYTYDAASNLKKEEYAKVGGRRGDRFTYDAYHRLEHSFMGITQAQMDASADPTTFVSAEMVKREKFTLDEAQNRENVEVKSGASTINQAYDIEDGTNGGPSNRYTVAAGAMQTHDLRGNLTYDGRFYYRYDFLNRLQEVWQVAPVDEEPIQDGENFVPVQDVEALEDSRKEAYDDVNNILYRVPREHMDPVFRARLRKTIVGGVVRVGGTQSGGGGMPRFVEPANLVMVALYGYDAFNRRVMRSVVGQGTWLSAYDGWREVVEQELIMTPPFQAPAVKQFVHGDGLDEIVSYRRKVGAAWEDYYLQHGGQDTAAKLLDQSGVVVEQYEYDAYGRATCFSSASGSWAQSAISPRGLPFLWKSIRLDQETGLLYMRNRYYSAETGRFLTSDPIGGWGDHGNMGNEYAYAWGTPLVMGDPLGLQTGVTGGGGGGIRPPSMPRSTLPAASPNIRFTNACPPGQLTREQRAELTRLYRLALRINANLGTGVAGIGTPGGEARIPYPGPGSPGASSPGIGPFADAESRIHLRGPQMFSRRFGESDYQQNRVNYERSGCHTCGTKAPGDIALDHQPPMNLRGVPPAMYLDLCGYPQCRACSNAQGARVLQMNRRYDSDPAYRQEVDAFWQQQLLVQFQMQQIYNSPPSNGTNVPQR
jgi:RHS repeat-associated protein